METTIIQSRRDLLLNWVEKNPILNPGEIGLVKITKNSEYSGMKIGNGHSKFNDLPLIKFNTNSGLVFGGIVRPDSGKPELSDSGSFWIAKDPGTYTEFGNLELEDFEIAILVWTGEKWEKQSLGIFKIDSELSGESEYPVQNKVIKNKFDEIEKTITTNEEAPKVKEITYSDLCSLRDNNKLMPGRQYRITDYQCTTSQPDTKSAGHQFDIIVTANSTNKLNETARAIQHTGDTYFAKSKLEAWKIWYCLDNDTKRFAWADSTNGKGVIYRMIDEYNNDCPYDFKNILITRHKLDTSKSSIKSNTKEEIPENIYEIISRFGNTGTIHSVYLIRKDSNRPWISNATNSYGYDNNENPYGLEITTDFSSSSSSYWVPANQSETIDLYTFSTFPYYYGISDLSLTESRNNSMGDFRISTTYYIPNNIFIGESYNNLLGKDCCNNTIGTGSYSIGNNKLGDGCQNNTIGLSNGNILGNECIGNILLDGGGNSFGSNCENNLFGTESFDNSFGNSCHYNLFGSNGRCEHNSFGNNCDSNSFGNWCYSNSFGNGCEGNKLGDYYRYNKFDNGVQYVTFNGTGNYPKYIQNYHIKQGMTFTSSSPYTITPKLNLKYELTVAKQTDGTVIEYCEDDLKKSIEKVDDTSLKYIIIK